MTRKELPNTVLIGDMYGTFETVDAGGDVYIKADLVQQFYDDIMEHRWENGYFTVEFVIDAFKKLGINPEPDVKE